MASKTVAPTSQIEAGKRILRTVIFIVLALCTAIPYVIQGVHFTDAQVTAILTQVAGVATALNALAITPVGQKALAWIGLDAGQVSKAQTDGAQTGRDTATLVATVQPVASDVVGKVKSGDVTGAVNAAVAATQPVADAAGAVVSDAQQIVADAPGAGEAAAGVDAAGNPAQP